VPSADSSTASEAATKSEVTDNRRLELEAPAAETVVAMSRRGEVGAPENVME
jgi:hypothetical protein